MDKKSAPSKTVKKRFNLRDFYDVNKTLFFSVIFTIIASGAMFAIFWYSGDNVDIVKYDSFLLSITLHCHCTTVIIIMLDYAPSVNFSCRGESVSKSPNLRSSEILPTES